MLILKLNNMLILKLNKRSGLGISLCAHEQVVWLRCT